MSRPVLPPRTGHWLATSIIEDGNGPSTLTCGCGVVASDNTLVKTALDFARHLRLDGGRPTWSETDNDWVR